MDPPEDSEPTLPDELLEGGLRAAFGPTPRAGDSVLERLEDGRDPLPRVLLPRGENAADEREAERGGPTWARSRAGGSYEILGEVARGGMGVILEGLDHDLGRHVAMKVLHEELAQDAAALRRFVEEARIGGQLQHPGVVPVYELGLMADERPYFAMKLIEGRTLSELLLDRATTDSDRARFLTIFHQVCQTVAYAHARGVIHRDLKPSNVMIGSFGEVQVVDWGVAKVLGGAGTSHAEREEASAASEDTPHPERGGTPPSLSVAGTVMGTPSYMPPEQAQGQVALVDERSDVFALGSILCTILTGDPPYPGETRAAWRAAAEARLEGALERLQRCDADEELVALCRRCLQPGRDARPQNAEIVARALGAYLASVEERAQRAQIAAAETRVKAREERKLILGAAGAVLVLAVAVGGGYLWTERQREARVAETTAVVGSALRDAEVLRGQAASSGDPLLWSEAAAAAERAVVLAGSRDAPPELEAQVASIAASIRSDEAAARAAAERESRGRELLARLEEIRLPEGESPYDPELQALDREYIAIFADYGMLVEEQEPEELVEGMRELGLARELAATLDEWTGLRERLESRDAAVHLMRTAILADDDPGRSELRRAILAGDRAAILRFADSENLEEAPVETLTVLAHGLRTAQDEGRAARVFRLAQRLHPENYIANVNLARNLRTRSPSEAIPYYTAAIALRPRRLEVRHELGAVLHQAGLDHARAEQIFRDALEIRPDDAHMRWHLGTLLDNLGRPDDAVLEFEEALRLDPEFADAAFNLGICLKRHGRLDDALGAFTEVLRITPDDGDAHFHVGRLLDRMGDYEGAIWEYTEAVRCAPAHYIAHNNLGVLLRAQGELDAAIREYREALRYQPGYYLALNNLGNALKARGEIPEAIELYRESIRSAPDYADGHRNLGAALRLQGDRAAAEAAYREALRLQPADAFWHHEHAELNLELGRTEFALRSYRRALELGGLPADVQAEIGERIETLGLPAAEPDADSRGDDVDPDESR